MSEIDSSAAARIRSWVSCVMPPRLTLSAARMKENSPIWASAAATVRLVALSSLKTVVMPIAAMDLPTMTMPRTPSTASGSRSRIVGSNNIPTETKNSTAKASRSGRDRSAALCPSGELFSTSPARKAPRSY